MAETKIAVLKFGSKIIKINGPVRYKIKFVKVLFDSTEKSEAKYIVELNLSSSDG